MELIEKYLEIKFPKWIKRSEAFHGKGGKHGIMSDDNISLEFRFTRYELRTRITRSPIVLNSNGREIVRPKPDEEITFDIQILLDKDEIYHFFSKSLGKKIKIEFDHYIVNGYIQQINYSGFTSEYDNISANITIISSDFKVL